MDNTQVSDQADDLSFNSSGDDQTSSFEGGQLDAGQVPIIPTFPEPNTTMPEQDDTPVSNDDAKARRVEGTKKEYSDAEWQQMKEQNQKTEKFMNAVAESLGLKPEEVDTEDPDFLKNQVVALQKDNEQRRWEAKHPVAITDKYIESWEAINSEPRFDALTYDEKWALVNKEKPSTAKQEIREKQLDEQNSVPMSSHGSSIPSSGLTPEEQEIAAAGGLTQEDFKAAGML